MKATNQNHTTLKQWIAEVREDLSLLALLDLGYPLGTNELRGPSQAVLAGIPAPLADVYRVMDGFSLPDIYNGYFMDAVDRVLSAQSRGQPVFVVGEIGKPLFVAGESVPPICVFGSDGGGGLFALGESNGAVYYLPCDGAVDDGRYFECSPCPVRRVAQSVTEFLDYIRSDIHAFVWGDGDHKYVTTHETKQT